MKRITLRITCIFIAVLVTDLVAAETIHSSPEVAQDSLLSDGSFAFSSSEQNEHAENDHEIDASDTADALSDSAKQERTIWSGPDMSFTKKDSADPTMEANQDRITDTIWLTRGSSGELYNAHSEQSSQKGRSPKDTEWAIGTVDKIDSLQFKTLRETSKPKSMVGKDMVLHLKTEDIYIGIRFTSWSPGRKGGFSYVRSTRE